MSTKINLNIKERFKLNSCKNKWEYSTKNVLK